MKTTIVTVGAVAATAVGGGAVDPGPYCYRSLRNPRGYIGLRPPYRWTPLYVIIAYAPRAARQLAGWRPAP